MEVTVKERLTGALILVAAAVIIVPEMLSGPEPRVATAAVTPAQPAEDGAPLRTYSLALDDNVAEAATLPPPAPPVQEPAAPASSPAPVAPAVQAVPAAQAMAAPAPKAAAPAAAPGEWWVKIGVYSSQDNADRLARQLRSAGLTIDVSKVRLGGKDMYRVRAGPAHDRAEAAALKTRVAATGNEAILVAP